jgi:hypothetical protein
MIFFVDQLISSGWSLTSSAWPPCVKSLSKSNPDVSEVSRWVPSGEPQESEKGCLLGTTLVPGGSELSAGKEIFIIFLLPQWKPSCMNSGVTILLHCPPKEKEYVLFSHCPFLALKWLTHVSKTTSCSEGRAVLIPNATSHQVETVHYKLYFSG